MVVSAGYMADNPAFFATSTPLFSGITSDLSNLYNGTNGFEAVNGNALFSVQWSGFFRAATSGNHTFYLASDDCGYIWLGANASTGFSTANALVSSPGTHPLRTAQGTVSLTAGTVYPLLIQYGQEGGTCDCQVSFAPPGGNRTFVGSGFYFNRV